VQPDKKQPNKNRQAPSPDHHQRHCVICRHPRREEIEFEFLHWHNPKTIAKQYRLGKGDPANVYRHARATGLVEQRRYYVRDALERILEKADRVRVTADAVVSAVCIIAQMNALDQWVEPAERIYLRDLFDRMTAEELEAYARDGKLPDWFDQAISATLGLASTVREKREPGTKANEARAFPDRKDKPN
jgi:hypothetical protein